MHVVGLTNMRARKMRDPFEAIGDEGSLVTIDTSEGLRSYASALTRGARVIERRDSDAVLAYNGSGLIGVVGAVLARRYDLPFLIRLNGDIYRQHREKTFNYGRAGDVGALAAHLPFAAMTRGAFRVADGFVPVSPTLDGIVHRQTGCPRDRIVSVPNPVRVDDYAGPSESGPGQPGPDESGPGEPSDRSRSADRQRLVTVTNLDFRGKYDGVTQLVDAVVPLLRERPEVEYVVAGQGHYYDRLVEYVDDRVTDHDVRSRIRVPGFVDDVASLYATSDLFVYASYIDGYPNVILEAQAAGLPVVTNPAYGIAEQIEDGESGVFVDPTDGREVASAVASLLDDPDERDRLAHNARQRVERENRPETVGSQLIEAVMRIVDAESDSVPTGDVAAPERAERR